ALAQHRGAVGPRQRPAGPAAVRPAVRPGPHLLRGRRAHPPLRGAPPGQAPASGCQGGREAVRGGPGAQALPVLPPRPGVRPPRRAGEADHGAGFIGPTPRSVSASSAPCPSSCPLGLAAALGFSGIARDTAPIVSTILVAFPA